MDRSTWIHVCPSWIAGPRSAHSKFGGGVVIGGIKRVEDRLLAIKERFPNDRSSGHVFHEVAYGDPVYAHLNNPNAISFADLLKGMEAGKYPLWSAMTSPAFGLPGVENGAILNPNPEIVAIAHYGHTTAIRWSKLLKKLGLGLGHTIWWPAFDSRLHRGLLSSMCVEQAWEKLFAFWIRILQAIPDEDVCEEGDVEHEYKPAVPGERDWIPTPQASRNFCLELNRRVGRKAMVINTESAHPLIGGFTVKEATSIQLGIDDRTPLKVDSPGCLFDGLVHVNSAELAIVQWNSTGIEIVAGTPGDDSDWAVGEGGEERWDDQQEAVGLLNETGMVIAAEHDIDPSGEDPMECYARSRANLETMIANVWKLPAAA
ncbi:MAG: hypothetical protein AAB871_00610 [Patescibacteria group bacterium]